MDQPNTSVSLNQWEALFNRARMELEPAKYNPQAHWAAIQEIGRVVSLRPRGASLSDAHFGMLVTYLEHACFIVPQNEEQAIARRKIAMDLLALIDPWRNEDNPLRSDRVYKITGLLIKANDSSLLGQALDLPGAPGFSQMLRNGWMQVDPEREGVVIWGMRAPCLEANTGSLATSLRWLALMAARATQDSSPGPQRFTLAEKMLLNAQTLNEPIIGEQRLLEFALRPGIVAEIVKRGGEPHARTTEGLSCLEKAIRRPEATPGTILGLARLAGPGGALENLDVRQRNEMAQAIVDAFIDRFPSQGASWPEAVAKLCNSGSQARTRDGMRMVDYIAKRLSQARQIDDNPLDVFSHLDIDLETAGQGMIDGVPAWLAWEWLVLRYPGGGGVDNPDRGVFCRGAGVEWSPACMLALVGSTLVDTANQARIILQGLEHDAASAMDAACVFFERLGQHGDIGMGLEFDISMMLSGIGKHMAIAKEPTQASGALVPWLVLFGKQAPTMLDLDPQRVLDSCARIEAIIQESPDRTGFLANQRKALAKVQGLQSAAMMMLQTSDQAGLSARPRL